MNLQTCGPGHEPPRPEPRVLRRLTCALAIVAAVGLPACTALPTSPSPDTPSSLLHRPSMPPGLVADVRFA